MVSPTAKDEALELKYKVAASALGQLKNNKLTSKITAQYFILFFNFLFVDINNNNQKNYNGQCYNYNIFSPIVPNRNFYFLTISGLIVK